MSSQDSYIEHLTERLLAAERRAEQEQQARGKAEQIAEEEQQAREKAEQLNQNTTFQEFLQACHEYCHKPLRVERNKSWTTKGEPKPANKYYPKTLTPWERFPLQQMEEFRKVYSIFHPAEQSALRLFDSIPYIKRHGEAYCSVSIANEQSLRFYEKVAVEAQIVDIINRLRENVQGQEQFRLGQNISFENNPNSLNDTAEEVQERLHIQPPRTPPSKTQLSNPPSPDSGSSPQAVRTRADQYCIYKNEGIGRELLFIVEYKPPHKLTVDDLEGFREMDVEKEVIKRIDIPAPIPPNETEVETQAVLARLQYNADKMAVAVAAQTFHYMIENGLEYSYIATGEAFVFLHIEEDDPTTLHYHVSLPSEDIVDGGSDFPYGQTALGQVLTLCLMAFRSERKSHAWRNNAKNKLKKYPVSNYETVLQETPATERKLALEKRKRAPKLSPYKGGKKIPVTSDYGLRSKCKPDNLPGNRHDEPDDPDASGSPTRPSPSNSRKNWKKPGSQGKDGGGESSKQASSSRGTQLQYCTQKCLLGIVRGSRLDRNCPNASLHPRLGEKHAVGRSKFLDLVQKQLADDLDHDCEPLGLQGARGALFKITLASHGYVLVGKGTVQAFVPDLLHEGKIYRRLAKLQGTAVPVYLGNIDLKEWYYLDPGVRILHMLLMSWGGGLADEDEAMRNTPALRKGIQRTTAEVREAGIDQMDVRSPNLLWNREVQRVMLIDFERAALIKLGPKNNGVRKERAMQEVSPNKKRKLPESPERKMRLDGFSV